MALPSSGAISLSQVRTELKLAAGANVSLASAAVRALAGVASGPIAMSQLRGKSSEILMYDGLLTVGQAANNNSTYTYGYMATTTVGALSPATADGMSLSTGVTGGMWCNAGTSPNVFNVGYGGNYPNRWTNKYKCRVVGLGEAVFGASDAYNSKINTTSYPLAFAGMGAFLAARVGQQVRVQIVQI